MKKRELVPLESERTLVRSVVMAAVGGAIGIASSAVWLWLRPSLLVDVAVFLYGLLIASILCDGWRFLGRLRTVRAARPVLSLVAEPLPEHWSGPFLIDPLAGSCAWRVDALEDGEPACALVALARTNAPSGPVVFGCVFGAGGQPTPEAAICKGLLRQLLPGNWRRSDDPGRGGLSFGCPLGLPFPLMLEDLSREDAGPSAPSEEPARAAFSCAAFEIPEPIAFPGEALSGELEHHGAIVREQLDGLWFQVRKPADDDAVGPFDGVGWLVAEVVVRNAKATVASVLNRAQLANDYEKILAVRRRLQRVGEAGCLEVIVRGEDAVSLHVTRLREGQGPKGTVSRVFEVDESVPALVEPTRQEHARYGGKTVVYWQAKMGSEVYRAVTSAPEPPRSIAEAVDRYVAFHLEDVRRAVWDSRELGATFALVGANRLGGEHVLVVDHMAARWVDLLADFPASREAIERHREYRDWFPVLLHAVRFAGVRWLPMRAGVDESTRPKNVDESSRSGHLRVVEG
jgi:hypothetical protein